MKAPIQSLVGQNINDVHDMGIFRNVAMLDVEKIGDESYLQLPLLGISMVLPDGETISAVQNHGTISEKYESGRHGRRRSCGCRIALIIVREKLGRDHGKKT